MSLEEILDFINWLDNHFVQTADVDHEKRVLTRMVKVSEETGEMAEAVMSYIGDQRKEKLLEFDKTHLSEECIDVIISTLLLAKALNVNIAETLEKKFTKIRGRLNG